MNDIYPSKELLRLPFGIDDNTCTFCENDVETTDHVFFSCNVIQLFWCDVHKRVKHQISSFPTSISRDDVTFGLSKGELCINTIACLAKFFIHNCRIVKSSPKFVVFF